MKKIVVLSSLAIGFIVVCSCSISFSCKKGSGELKTENREVSSFHNINLKIGADVELVQSENVTVFVIANENLLQHIETRVNNNTLIIETADCNCLDSDDPITVKIGIPVIKGINVCGSGTVWAKDRIVTENLGLNVSGSGDIIFDQVMLDNYSVDIAGSGNVQLKGSPSKSGDINISGSGDVDASKLATSAIAISIAGSGDVIVKPTAALDVSIAGSGDVHYVGSPVVVKSILGSGEVIQD